MNLSLIWPSRFLRTDPATPSAPPLPMDPTPEALRTMCLLLANTDIERAKQIHDWITKGAVPAAAEAKASGKVIRLGDVLGDKPGPSGDAA